MQVSDKFAQRSCKRRTTLLKIVDMPADETADRIMSFRAKPSLADKIEAAAKDDRRTLSNYLALLVEDALESRGAA